MKKTNIDSPFYRTMGKIGDLLFESSVAGVLFAHRHRRSLHPGALFTVVNKMAAKEDYTVHTDFFKAFKRDFKAIYCPVAGAFAGRLCRPHRAAHRHRTGHPQHRHSGGSVLSAAGAGRLLRQLGLCPAGTVHLSRRSAGAGGQRPHDPCKPAAHCGESGFSGVVSSAGKKPPLRGSSICCPCGCSSAAQVLPLAWQSLMRPAFAQLEKAGRKEEEPEEEPDTEDSVQ